MDGQIKPGIRNMMIILIIALLLIPATKVAVDKLSWVPDPIRNWIKSA